MWSSETDNAELVFKGNNISPVINLHMGASVQPEL